MEVIELVEEMQSICNRLRCNGTRIKFIPTMGALHAGHASLIEAAKAAAPAAATNYEFICRNDNGPVIRDSANDVTPGDDDDGRKESPNEQSIEQLSSFLADRILDLALEVATRKSSSSSSIDDRHPSTTEQSQSSKVVVIVSIFVNPKQFNIPNDFLNYPKNFQKDLDTCKRLNVDYVFAPSSSQMYPEFPSSSGIKRNQSSSSSSSAAAAAAKKQQDHYYDHCMVVPPSNLSNSLEGKSRPGHFEGMLTVVCKLFNIIKPNEAYFGEKDYQQVVLVSKMVNDLNMDVKIVPVRTVREPDQLPMSSRNVRLNERQRRAAPVIYELLADAKRALEAENDDANNSSMSISSTLTNTIAKHELAESVELDYLELRCAKDLSEISCIDDLNWFDCKEGCVERQLKAGGDIILKARLLASIILTDIRLLDNIEVELNLYH